jgi:hypothetical protein
VTFRVCTVCSGKVFYGEAWVTAEEWIRSRLVWRRSGHVGCVIW